MDGLATRYSVNSCIASVRPESDTLQNNNDVYPCTNRSLAELSDVLLTIDGNVGSVQKSENTILEVSWKTFVVLIRRVQSPVPLGDSSLRVQLGPTLIWNVLPTVGSIPRGSLLL